ncbi:MAG: AMP-binding protein [Acidimicrobiia bacterium]|nr:AMP-binding protein [Acidimicrobiia bacterium]
MGWAEVDESLNRVANKPLSTDRGPARRVAVFGENAAETTLAHLGGLIAGASTVPVNFHLTGAEAAYMLEDSAARVSSVMRTRSSGLGDVIERSDSASWPRDLGTPRQRNFGTGCGSVARCRARW